MYIQTDNRKRVRHYLFLWLDLAALSAKVLVLVFSFVLILVLIVCCGSFARTLFPSHWTLWGHHMSKSSCPAPSVVGGDRCTDNGVTFPLGGTPRSDLWLGKTDELLLPPCFFARSILHVGVCFMNDGDLLKPSIQLPKDTAPAPIAPTNQE